MRQFLTIVFILAVFNLSVSSQPEREIRITKWDFDIATGGIIGGPSQRMLTKLWHSGRGLDWDVQTKTTFPLVIGADRRINNFLRLNLSASLFQQNLVHNKYEYTEYNFKMATIGPSISYNYRDLLFIGAGPALVYTDYYHPTGSSIYDDETYLEAGFTAKTFVEFPRDSRIHLRGEIQYNYFRTINSMYTIVGVGPSQYATRLIRIKNLHLNYFYFGLGLGIRLFGQ